MSTNANWVNASRPPVIPGTSIHASTLSPVVLMLVYFAWITFFIAAFCISFMGILRLKGRSLTWLIRKTKWRLRGRQVQARPVWYRRRFNRIETLDTAGIPREAD
jgi:intracellular multiplication protein IcmT